ncbi:hypothetical protein WICMUC_000892 [Wickerhamomyces mucosus]|uniref:Thiamine pyrophosphokinase n=1 Tax=Wickerhamomyces mucosus TaxID=1378264 RepID=A0A9P8PYG8_9ASCO|nr:hypothetical protein WICMUC_000892 [Wickerhamomyces mucosus]
MRLNYFNNLNNEYSIDIYLIMTFPKNHVIENEEKIRVQKPQGSNVVNLDIVFNPISPHNNALIILNQSISIVNFLKVWEHYRLKICADGGANRLFDFFSKDEDRKNHLPDYIIGDFDSLRDDVKRWYESHGVKTIKQSTQYATDLNKCLDFVEIYYDGMVNSLAIENINDYDGILKLHAQIKRKGSKIDVLILGGIDGRFDHTIHSISLLLKLSDLNPNLSAFFITFTDLIFLIPKGSNSIEFNTIQSFHGSNCGLLPLGGPVVLSTSGLKWDVKNWESSIKGAVSSSNRIVGDSRFLINTNDDLVLSIELDYDKISNYE